MNPEPRANPDSTPIRGSAPNLTPNPEAPIYRGRRVGVGVAKNQSPSSARAKPLSAADLQAARDAEYSSAYRDWVASLSPEERAQLDAGGISEPDTSRQTSTREHDDSVITRTESPEPSPGDDLVFTSPKAPPLPPSSDDAPPSTTAADILASFCARIRAHPHPLLAFDAACYASGLMDVEGLSETALAKRHGVTRAAFSKLVVQWSQTFGLSPSRGMRSKRARRSYRKARLNYLSKRKSYLHHVH